MIKNTFNVTTPLSYRISDWKQLEKCKSNNSRYLSIKVTTFINDYRINGRRITLTHEVFGPLFTCVVDAKGTLISESDEGYIHEFTVAEILAELQKYGFNITYNTYDALTSSQIDLLMTVNNLGFDKIRVVAVWDSPLGIKENTIHVVAFMIDPLGDWLNSGYSPSISEYKAALANGYAIDVTQLSNAKNMNWSWLYGWVGDINDILEEQSRNPGIDEDYYQADSEESGDEIVGEVTDSQTEG